ncbi:MAG: glycosyltransferase family 4 protein [Saprospiraceae bacterium]|nr:glycosyltransferase family 4 protein [Saprospiraceae bacterium]
MKRIICTVSNDLTYDQRMIRICTTLAKAGYSVKLVGRGLPESRPLTDQPFAQQRMKLILNKGKLFYLELNLRLLFKLLFGSFDVVYSVDLDTLLPARFVAFLRNKALIFDAHEYFTEVPELVVRPISKKVWELAASMAIPGLKHAITVGQCLADVMGKRYGVAFTVVRNLPNRGAAVALRERNRPFVLIYQGVLNDGRGLEESILAMKYLEDAVLWLCGEGDLSRILRELVAMNNLGNKVKFLGKLPPERLAELTKQADLGLNLLKNKGLNYYYSLANKAADYVHAGLPSLAMRFPEYVKLNEKYGVFKLVDELEPEQIAAAVNALRSNIKQYGEMAANCRKAATELNWEEESKRLLELFERLD